MKKVILRKKRIEDFRWWFTYEYGMTPSGSFDTTIRIYFQFKKNESVLAQTIYRMYKVPYDEGIQEMVEMYLKTQFNPIKKFIWLKRKEAV